LLKNLKNTTGDYFFCRTLYIRILGCIAWMQVSFVGMFVAKALLSCPDLYCVLMMCICVHVLQHVHSSGVMFLIIL